MMEIAYFCWSSSAFLYWFLPPSEGGLSTHTHTFLRWNERPLSPSLFYFCFLPFLSHFDRLLGAVSLVLVLNSLYCTDTIIFICLGPVAGNAASNSQLSLALLPAYCVTRRTHPFSTLSVSTVTTRSGQKVILCRPHRLNRHRWYLRARQCPMTHDYPLSTEQATPPIV